MKIMCIFANKLFAFRYEGENENEYDRLMELWTDSDFVHQFLKENKADIPKNLTINMLESYIIEDSEELDNQLIKISENEEQELEQFFSPLHNQEYQIRSLSLRKKRERYLRMYAIRVDSDLFVITGGAIKLTYLMEDRPHTKEELGKLNTAKDFLVSKGIFDEDSFFEFLNESYNDE